MRLPEPIPFAEMVERHLLFTTGPTVSKERDALADFLARTTPITTRSETLGAFLQRIKPIQER